MRFVLGVAATLTALVFFLFGGSCLDPFRYDEYEAMVWLLAFIWGAVLLIAAFVHVAKNPPEGALTHMAGKQVGGKPTDQIHGSAPEPQPPEGRNQRQIMAKEVASVSGKGTQAKSIDLPEGLYVVTMSVNNQSEGDFAVTLEAAVREYTSLLANEIVDKWEGSKPFRVGDVHPPGGQLLGVESSGSWSVTFTRH